ncbi:hypothetical protein AB0F42_30105 [Streptomyces buecherae]|uniref:hypothetical protein n=1 Tax=Streptomyces buecherae TaxID=2763006 RepID=UPI0033E408D7
MTKSARLLAALELASAAQDTPTTTTVAELARAGALTLRGGQQPPETAVRTGTPSPEDIPLPTVPDLLSGGAPREHLAAHDPAVREAVIAEPGDIVVVGVARAFSAWVHAGAPTALGAQLHAVRVQPEQLDAWFLAGTLRAPANVRQAGTHATSSSRIDIRRLQVRQVPLHEQRRYGEAFRELAAFEQLARRTAELGADLVHDLGDELAAGRLAGRGVAHHAPVRSPSDQASGPPGPCASASRAESWASTSRRTDVRMPRLWCRQGPRRRLLAMVGPMQEAVPGGMAEEALDPRTQPVGFLPWPSGDQSRRLAAS